jgi:hypothetical protein
MVARGNAAVYGQDSVPSSSTTQLDLALDGPLPLSTAVSSSVAARPAANASTILIPNLMGALYPPGSWRDRQSSGGLSSTRTDASPILSKVRMTGGAAWVTRSLPPVVRIWV